MIKKDEMDKTREQKMGILRGSTETGLELNEKR